MPFNVIRRLITLNGMKASEEITEEQSRQVFMASRQPKSSADRLPLADV